MPAPQVGEEEQAGDDREEPEGVEQTVGHQADVSGRLVVEVVPVQQLVEDGFVDERDQPDAREHSGRGVSPLRHGSHPLGSSQ